MVKGPTTYEEIRRIGDVQYLTFREACFAMGFLDDDKEFVGTIREAYQWGSGYFLRRLFVVMFLAGTMNRPRHLWHKTIHWLSDGILREQRLLANNQGIQTSNTYVYTSLFVYFFKINQFTYRIL